MSLEKGMATLSKQRSSAYIEGPKGFCINSLNIPPPPKKIYSLFTVTEGSESNHKFVKTSVLMEGE